MLHDFQTTKASLKRVGNINEEISGKKWFKAINQIDPKKKKELKVKFGWLLKKIFKKKLTSQ